MTTLPPTLTPAQAAEEMWKQRKVTEYPLRSGVTSLNVQKAIDDALSGLHEDEKGAVVFHVDSDNNVQASVFAKASGGSGWSYVMTGNHQGDDWKSGWTGLAAVRYSWR